MEIFRAADHRRMPWKNGGGETLEIAVHPPKAELADFSWRLSMARVEVDGPFSAFAGIDRTLAVLEGDGIELSVGPQPAQVLRPASPPFSFPGDVPTVARLTGGPIRDLNVMTRRGQVTHSVERLAIDRPIHCDTAGAQPFVLCIDGSVGLDDRTRLGRYDVAAYAAGEAMVLLPVEAAGAVFLIRIRRANSGTAFPEA